MIEKHNTRCKVEVLRSSIAQAEAKAAAIDVLLEAVSKGDWSLVEPFEIADTKGKDDKQDKQPQ